MKKNWKILQPDINLVKKICRLIKCSDTIGTILANRDITSEKELTAFMKMSLKNLRPPFQIKDMETAVKRIASAILKNERILIFGDYDVDGVTATSILYEFLKNLGIDVHFYIPHRLKEGYGLKKENITNYAYSNKIDLIITVDCGSNSIEAVEEANRLSIDVIITDHHEILKELPKACAIVNPKRKDCTAGFESLAGVGVAYYLLISLRKHLRDMNFWRTKNEPNLKIICELVALGTIADVVPMVNENRILIKTGIEQIKSKTRIGIKALIKAGKIDKNSINSEEIAFRIAPVLNAAGRMDHASYAVDLLTTKNYEEAESLANRLNTLNAKRRNIEKEAIDRIFAYIHHTPSILKKKVIILGHESWHEGVIGIMASRLAERFKLPVVLIAITDGIGKGSARSIPGFDIYKGFTQCSKYFDSFGGHSMAAGIKIKVENIKKFKEDFEKIVEDFFKSNTIEHNIFIDKKLEFDDINGGLIDELESLMPFGTNNSEPLFLAENIKVLKSWIVGKNHKRMLLTHPGSYKNKVVNAIQFNVDLLTSIPIKNSFEYIVFKLKWNRWNKNKTIQIVVEDFW
mmetsp:Transcript_1635/g.1134  ORF Transcript_1635/g.1134 Transcript_1635/m.1134 type:complete len:575 (+) Transcript_1635:1379-3103(+)